MVGFIQRLNLQLRWKLLGGFIGANILLVVALVLALFTLSGTNDTFKKIDENNQRETLTNRIELSLERMIGSALDSVLSGKSARLIEYDLASANLERTIKSFKPNPSQQKSYDELVNELKNVQQMLDSMVKSRDSNNLQIAIDTWNQQGSRQIERIRELNRDIAVKERSNNIREYENATSQIAGTIISTSILSLLAILLAIGLVFLITEALVRPVKQLRKGLTNLADGDLTGKVQISNLDEMGNLAGTYNETLLSLGELVRNLREQSQKVSTATAELNSQANNLVSGSSQQVIAIREATQTIQELSHTAEAIAQQATAANAAFVRCLNQADEVNQLAENMATTQEHGRQIVAQTVSGLFRVNQQVESINEHQQELLKQSDELTMVVSFINDIAKSIHLLALNASIEAAGAGEFGERFKVVAREVKELADQSVMANREIDQVLTRIISSVREVNELGNSGLEEARRAVEQSRTSDNVLVELAALSDQVRISSRQIYEDIRITSVMAGNIHEATQQQQVASSQMLSQMLSIDTVTSQNLSSLKQSEMATQALNFSALELARSADSFKLELATK
jgi:methyl-accepting chemotaxis protein